ncbi:sensor histidine kinase [Azotosporobacter soli]|uniref:sensor histidine kinase n=1 Tax=Azotosporobacter soli TaxID=3055040 RepID=UPI0031FEDC9A
MFGVKLNSLRTRLCLGVFLASIFPYLLGGAYISQVVIERIQTNYIQQARTVIDKVQSDLDHAFLSPVENLVTALANDDRLLEISPAQLNNYIHYDPSSFVDRDDPLEQTLKRYFKNMKNNHSNIDTIFLASSWGGYMETPPFMPKGSYDPRLRAWYKNTIAQPGQIVTTDPYITAVTNQMVVSVTHTIERDAQTIGVVGVMLYLTEFQKKVVDTNIGQTGYLLILNPNNKIIVSPKHPEWLLKTPAEVGVSQLTQLEEKANMLKPFTADNLEQIMLVSPPDKRGWKVIAIIDRAELEAQAAPLRNLIISVYAFTLLLVLLTIIYATTRITRPLEKMTSLALQMADGNLETTEIKVSTSDELGQLALSFSRMARNLKQSYSNLEMRVEDRTQDLNAANEELQAMNLELNETIIQLSKTQALLVKTEKMAALGSLVAGVAHEINTPAGVALTAASHLDSITKELAALYAANSVKRRHLTEYIEEAGQSAQIILANLEQAIRLVRHFKQVSVDHTYEQRQSFNLREYIENTLSCFATRLSAPQISVSIDCASDLEIDSYPEAFSQVLSNLLANSLLHAYQPEQQGHITIAVTRHPTKLILKYTDDGKGIAADIQDRIFEPFFTTKRETGAIGLGLSIVYNIIAQQFSGMIECSSAPEQGTTFTITLPLLAE